MLIVALPVWFVMGFADVYRKCKKMWLLDTGRHFWNRKCRKKTWWQQEFAVLKCEATANSVTGHVCVYSNKMWMEREFSEGNITAWRIKYHSKS